MQLNTIRHLDTEISALVAEATYQARSPKICWQSATPLIAPSWLDGMCRNVMVNGNQSKLLGSGAAVGLGMEENERENVPLISVKTDPRPADTVAAVASSGGSKLTSVREPEDSCSVIPPPSLGSFYWISERNVYKMTTVLLKTGWVGGLGGEKKAAMVNEMKAGL